MEKKVREEVGGRRRGPGERRRLRMKKSWNNRPARRGEGCRSTLGARFAWLHSAGDFNYFSAPLPLLLMSCMLRSPASD